MKSLFKTMLLATIASVVLFSCTDLDEELVGDITTAVSVDAPASAGSGSGGGDALAGAYAELRNSGTANHFGYFSLNGIASDEMTIAAKGGDWYDGGVLIEVHQHTYSPTNGMVGSAWNGQYGAIGNINDAIANLDLDNSQKAQLKALRAYFYWRLLDMFGSVKIVTTPGQSATQSNPQQVFNFIETELLATLGVSAITASMDLSSSPLGLEANAYRINRYAALGILSKLYLNSEAYTGVAKYQEAHDAADYIITNGPYSLSDSSVSVPNLGKRPAVDSDPNTLTGYAAVFAPNNQGNPEHIFTVNYDEATAGGMNFAKMTLHYASQFTWNFQDQPWNGYAALEDFYNSYEAGDSRRANNFIVGPQLDFGGSAVLDYASDDGDPPLVYTPNINELQPNALREGGARLGKFSFQQFGRPDQNNDFPIIRLGDVHLVRAEAKARVVSNWSDAATLADVNAIRARAGVSAMTSLTAADFLAERGREMFQETSRRTDLIRFGQWTSAWWEKPTEADDHTALFPIPFDQIQAGAGLTQNPGY